MEHLRSDPRLSSITCRAYDDFGSDRATDRQSDRETDSADRDRRERESSLDRSDDRPYWALTGEERAERARELCQEAKERAEKMREHAARELGETAIEGFREDQANARATELEVFPDGRPGRDMDKTAKTG